MPTTMNVSLPEPMKAFVDEQVQAGGYGSTSDYIRQLIREHRAQIATETLRKLIAEGMASGSPAPVTPAYWNSKRKQHGL